MPFNAERLPLNLPFHLPHLQLASRQQGKFECFKPPFECFATPAENCFERIRILDMKAFAACSFYR